MQFDLPYLVQDVDRHGNVRLYVRLKVDGKFRKERLRSPAGSPQFLDEYRAALGHLKAGHKGTDAVTIKIGTLGWLVHEYEQSFNFKRIAPREQRVRHLILESCLNEETKAGSGYRFRDCPLAEFTSDHVRLMRDRKKGRPGAANNRVKWLSAMFNWACEERSAWVKSNPATIKKATETANCAATSVWRNRWRRSGGLMRSCRSELGSVFELRIAGRVPIINIVSRISKLE